MNLESFAALSSIQEQIGPIKKELKALERDIKKTFKKKDAAEAALYLVVNAINRGLPPHEVKRIAVKGLKASK